MYLYCCTDRQKQVGLLQKSEAREERVEQSAPPFLFRTSLTPNGYTYRQAMWKMDLLVRNHWTRMKPTLPRGEHHSATYLNQC